MKQIQQLKLSNSLFPSLLAGTKKCTVRAGKRGITTGPLLFISTDSFKDCRGTDDYLFHKVEVTEVRHKKLSELNDTEARMDGSSNAQELRDALKQFYPTLKADDEITVIIYK